MFSVENEIVNRVQPSDTIAEQAVLGSMLVDKDATIAAMEILKPEDFYREDNKEIYAAMLELYGLGQQIDMITLSDQLKLRGTLEKVGDTSYIATLIDNQKDILELLQKMFVALKDVPVEDLQKEFVAKLAEIIHTENKDKTE